MNDQEFAAAVAEEIQRARRLFPGAEATSAAMIEEVGEVCKALMYEPWDALVKECVQVAAMAQRLATEGDDTMRRFREKHVHDFGRRYQRPEHEMPEMPPSARTSHPNGQAQPNSNTEKRCAKCGEPSHRGLCLNAPDNPNGDIEW